MKLFTNHADAWGVTLIIGLLALVLHQRLNSETLALVAALTLCYWFGFALNDYFDRFADARDPVKAMRNFFIGHHIPGPIVLLAGLLILSGLFVIFAQHGVRGKGLFVTGLVAMWAYSAPPLRLKKRAGLDLLMHGLFVETFPYFATLFLLQLEWQLLDYVLLTFFLLGSIGAQLEQQARDYVPDIQAGESNFAICYGLPLTITLLRLTTALLIGLMIFSSAAGVIPPVLIPLGLITLPILVHRFLRGVHQPRSERLVRVMLVLAVVYASIVSVQMVLG